MPGALTIVSPQSALFGRKRRSQTEGGARAEDKPWARFTAKVTATFTSLGPTSPQPQQGEPRRAQTPTAEMMMPRRLPTQTLQVEVEVEPRRQQSFVHPYNHPFLKETGPPPSISSRRESLKPPPRPSSRRLSIQSSASDLTYVSAPNTPIMKHTPSFKRSTSPPRSFNSPTPLPTPPPSAKHTTFLPERTRKPSVGFPTERIERTPKPWSGHRESPPGRTDTQPSQ